MSKENKIKILHLEDLPTDAELVARVLKKSDLSFDVIVVDKENDFIHALRDFSPDIILSDHSLPLFSSIGALKILREQQLDIPFILITSTTSEEVAVNVMKEGAWDYILKDRMQRLPAAILNALEKSKARIEKQKYIEKIIFNEKRFRSLIESIEDIIVLIDANFHVIYRSPNFERITGWSISELGVGLNKELTHPEDQAIVGNVIQQVIANPQQHIAFNSRLKHKSGEYLFMEGVATSLLSDEETKSIVFTLRDVTEKNKAKLELRSAHERLLFHFDNSPLGFIEWDNQFLVKQMSVRAEEIFGWKTDEYRELQKNGKLAVYHEDYALAEQKANELLHGGVSRNHLQERLVNRSGKVIWTELFNSVLRDDKGDVVTILSLVSDITQHKEAELNIRQSQANLNAIIESADASIYSLDRNFRYISFNSILKKSLKNAYNIDVAIGDPVFDFLKELDVAESESWEKVYTEAFSGKSVKFEKEFSIGDYYQWSSFSINPIWENEKVIGLSCFVRDITDQKNAQKKLAESEKHFRSLVENISDGIVVSDKDQNLLYQSPSVTKILGYTEEERRNQSLKRYVHPAYEKQYLKIHEVARKDSAPHPFEFPFLHKNGTYVWLEGVITNLLDEPSVGGVVANYRDITQRKMLNDILKEYNDRHEIVSKATNDAIWDWNIEKDQEIWNHGIQSIFGYTEREVSSSHRWWQEKLHPADTDRINNELETTFRQQKENWTSQYQYRCVDGTYKHVLDRAYIIYKNDIPVRMIGAMQDITNQVIFEQKLRSLNERYEMVLDTTGEAVWDWDLITNTIIWGEGLFNLYGHRVKGEVDDSYWLQKIHPKDRQRTENFIQEVLSNPKQIKWEDEYQFRRSDGTYAFVHDRGTIIRDENGRALRMVGSMQDVTEQKLANEEIEKLSLVASRTHNGVMVTDPNGFIEWVNASFSIRSEYTLDEVKGRKSDFLQGPETDPFTVRRISEKLKRQEYISEEIINYSKSRKKYWIKLDIVPVYDEDKKLKNFISIQTDISELKEFEKSITSIARELASLIENANVPIFGVDRNGYINEWNGITSTLTEYGRNEVFGKKWIDFLAPDIHDKFQEVLQKVLKGNSMSNYELPFKSQRGGALTLLMSISTRRDTNKNVIGALCVGQDVTEVTQYRQGLEKLVTERTHELNDALKKEKELVEMKSKFVSIASHEFRTPLSTISLATGFLRKYKKQMVAEDIDKKLDNIEKQVAQMTYLLDDVLLVGKAEAGKIQVNRSEIELSTFEKLAEEVIESKQTKHRLRFSKKGSVTSVQTDEKLVRNIIINLVTNAVKFSPEVNEIEMDITCSKKDLIITVRDHGIGIPEHDIKELFTSFSRGSNVGAIEGTGLGLSIVKKAVDLLGGTIALKSSLGKGSEFKVTLPLHNV